MIIPIERFHFKSLAFPNVKFHVLHFTGTEKLNETFLFHISLVSEQRVDLVKMFTNAATFSITKEDGTSVSYLGAIAENSGNGVINGFHYITVHLVPFFSGLKYQVNSKIYLDKKLPNIIDEIMCGTKFVNLNYEIRFSQKYPVQEFSMQYNESNYNYLLYKLEELGAYFYFDETGDKIIFADSPKSHDKAKEIMRYQTVNGMEPDTKEKIITDFSISMKVSPGRIIVRNYDWKEPNRLIIGAADALHSYQTFCEKILTNEAVSTQEQADFIAEVRAEQLICTQYIGTGKSSNPSLRPGVVFTLTEDERDELNRDYMVTKITHEGNQEAVVASLLHLSVSNEQEHYVYKNSFSCIPADVSYRPERKTPRNTISGMLNAFIDGDDANSPVLDEYGRYKVLFPFDLSGRSGGKASCWIRRVQEQVGKDSGMTFPLLPGTEVVLSFIDGNPDRPIISGALPNGETGSLSYAENKNFSGIRTPGGAQLTFDNTHNAVSLANLSGSGIKFGSGSMDYMESDTHVALNSCAVGGTNISGFFKNTLSGFKSLKLAMCGEPMTYIFGILTTLLGEADNILTSLASQNKRAGKEQNKLEWGSAGIKMFSVLLGSTLPILIEKVIPGATYNVQLVAGKKMASSTIQCFPSTAEIVANAVMMLVGRLISAGTAGADAAIAQKELDQDLGDKKKFKDSFELYKKTLLEALQTIYDAGVLTTDQNELKKFNGKGEKGEYYTEAENMPCAVYSTANAGLSLSISQLEIYLSDSTAPEEKRTIWQKYFHDLKSLSLSLDVVYRASCYGTQSKEEVYHYKKIAATRKAVTSQIASFLPELSIFLVMLLRKSNLMKKNIGGIFLNAMDKNINLHASTYIGQHAERGIYLNTIEAEIDPVAIPPVDKCSDWGAPLKLPSLSGVDSRISGIFSHVSDEQLVDVNKSVADFIKSGHANSRKVPGDIGDGIEPAADKDTTFIAEATHFHYTEANNVFGWANSLYKIIAPNIVLRTKKDQNSAVFTCYSSGLITARALAKISALAGDPNNRKKCKTLNLTGGTAILGIPPNQGDTSVHGLAISNKNVTLVQKQEGAANKPAALALEKEKASLSVSKKTYLTLDGAKEEVRLGGKKAHIAGFCFEKNRISKGEGGCLVFGDNDVKISNVAAEERFEPNHDQAMENMVSLFEQEQPKQQPPQEQQEDKKEEN